MIEPALFIGGACLAAFGASIVAYGQEIRDRFSRRTGLAGAVAAIVAIAMWVRP